MANLEVLALDTAVPQIRAPGAGDGYSVPRDMTFAAATTLSVPTVDATNVEVTNVKAKDGTAALTIADSTGVVTASANPILSGGTANGVLYLNGSKVATSGSALTFDGTNLSATHGLKAASSGIVVSSFVDGLNVGGYDAIGFAASPGTLLAVGGYRAAQWAGVEFYASGALQATLNTTGLGIGTASPTSKLSITTDSGTSGLTGYGISLQDTSTTSGDIIPITFTFQSTAGRARAGIGGISQVADAVQGYGGAIGFYTRAAADASNLSSSDERMRIDSSGNVGIGTSSPTAGFRLDVVGGDFRVSDVASDDGVEIGWSLGGNVGFVQAYDRNASAFRNLLLNNAVTIDTSGNVGIGTSSPAAKLDVAGAAQVYKSGKATITALDTASYAASVGGTIDLGGNYRTTGDYQSFVRIAAEKANAVNNDYGYNMGFYVTTNGGATFGTKALTIDSSGNLGLGVTPAAWAGAGHIIQFNNDGASIGSQNSGDANFMHNAYESPVGTFKYVSSGIGSLRYQLDINNNAHKWFTAPSGTAGNTITFTQAMTLDASGQLLLGTTTSSNFKLDIVAGNAFRASSSGTSAALYISGGTPYFGTTTNHAFAFITNDAERARITAGGSVQINADSTNTTFTSAGQLAIKRSSGDPVFSFHGNTGSQIGYLQWQDAGTCSVYVGVNQALSFSTNATERARITAGGYFKASNDGTYISSTGAYHEFDSDAAGSPVIRVKATNASYADYVMYLEGSRAAGNNYYFLRCVNNANQLLIQDDGDVTNTNGAYGSISDIKLKQDVIDAPSQWNDLKAVRFRKYRMKSDVEAQGDNAPYLLGVVAQELAEVSPGLVEAHPDTEQVEVTDEDGNIITKTRPTGTETLSVKSSILLMKAAVALQEAMSRIEQLEAKVAALESK